LPAAGSGELYAALDLAAAAVRGFWAFLIARGFTTKETMGLVPFSQAALTRWRVQARTRLGWAVLGALLLLVVLYRIAWPFAFFGGCVLVAFLFGFAWVSLLGGGEVGARFDPEAPTVLLWVSTSASSRPSRRVSSPTRTCGSGRPSEHTRSSVPAGRPG
jgi:hypothetical protein